MKNNITKKIIIISIIAVIVILAITGILIINKDEELPVDKPLSEVTMDDFKKTKVEIGVMGFEYPDYDYANIYKECIKPKYSNISVVKGTSDIINVTAMPKEALGDEINGIEVLDLKPFIDNEFFGFKDKGENNFGSVYMEYVYGLTDGEIYAIPEYINLPCILYNSIFAESLDILVPSRWSDLAIVKGELLNFKDYQNHLVAGYDRDHFDIVSSFIQQGYEEEIARYIIESWEKNGILKGYDKTNMDELVNDSPIIFIMPNSDTINALGKYSSTYSIGGMLLDDEDTLYINCKDGKNGKYLSVLKGDNVYEDIASWLFLKGSIDNKYSEALTVKPYLEDNSTANNKGEYNYIICQLLQTYEKMHEKGQIIFYNK